MKLPAITPGPWESDNAHDIPEVWDANDNCVAECHWIGRNRNSYKGVERPTEEIQANAKAIAAVPANLAANLKALDILRRLLAEQQIDMGEVEAVADELDAALRLAGATE